MKKLYTRIAACSLAVLIAFNTVAIPKAEAVITESALVSAFVATYSAAAGFAYRGEEFPGTSAAVAIAQQLDAGARAFAETKQIAKEEFDSIVASGIEFVGNGVLKISKEASDLLSGFTDWLVNALWVVNGMPLDSEVPCVPNYKPSYGSIDWVNLDTVWTDKVTYPYAAILYNAQTNGYELWLSGAPFTHYSQVHSVVTSGVPSAKYTFVYGDPAIELVGFYDVGVSGIVKDTRYVLKWSSHDIVEQNYPDIVFFAGAASVYNEDWQNPVLYATLSSDYEAPPKVEDQYSMLIDTGMTIEDEQDFVDSVLGGMLAGTLAPTYTIEQAAGGDVVVPDEDEETDTQAGILSSVKNIAQNVIALPQTIAEKIKGIFVPDAALTTEIADAFAAKFSFVPTLHRLGTDLLSIGPDSKPPVVYIHLEDAEGAIDYGGTVKALDMSWYQRYKEDGDRIIGGFLWLGFLWLLFKRVPAIINGGEMVQEYTAAIDRGSKRRKH